MPKLAGCSLFVAPEVVWRGTDRTILAAPAVDVWALGMIALHMVLPKSEKAPQTQSEGESDDATEGEEHAWRAVEGMLRECEGFCEQQWLDFIQLCLKRNPEQRASLEHLILLATLQCVTDEHLAAISVSAHACYAALPPLVCTAQHSLSGIDDNVLLRVSESSCHGIGFALL